MSEVPDGVQLSALVGGSATNRHNDAHSGRAKRRGSAVGPALTHARLSELLGVSRRRRLFCGPSAAVEALSQLAGPEAASIACIMREMSEELGLAASGDGAIAVDPEARAAIVEDKKRWLPLALEGSFPVERERIRTLSHRITPVWPRAVRQRLPSSPPRPVEGRSCD